MMQKRQKSGNCYMRYCTHELKYTMHIRKVCVIRKAFGREQMSGGSNKCMQNKSWQCTDKVTLDRGCSPSLVIKRCFAFAGKTNSVSGPFAAC